MNNMSNLPKSRIAYMRGVIGEITSTEEDLYKDRIVGLGHLAELLQTRDASLIANKLPVAVIRYFMASQPYTVMPAKYQRILRDRAGLRGKIDIANAVEMGRLDREEMYHYPHMLNARELVSEYRVSTIKLYHLISMMMAESTERAKRIPSVIGTHKNGTDVSVAGVYVAEMRTPLPATSDPSRSNHMVLSTVPKGHESLQWILDFVQNLMDGETGNGGVDDLLEEQGKMTISTIMALLKRESYLSRHTIVPLAHTESGVAMLRTYNTAVYIDYPETLLELTTQEA